VRYWYTGILHDCSVCTYETATVRPHEIKVRGCEMLEIIIIIVSLSVRSSVARRSLESPPPPSIRFQSSVRSSVVVTLRARRVRVVRSLAREPAAPFVVLCCYLVHVCVCAPCVAGRDRFGVIREHR